MADHMVALHQKAQQGRGAELATEVAGERHAALQATCEADGTLTEVRCVLATNELAELSRCAPQ